MKIFLDVDNTILEHSGFYSIETESRVHSVIGKYPLENATAIRVMYESAICRNPDIVRKLLQLDFVYILTKYPTIEYETHKQERVAHIMGITREELLELKDSQGHKKYIYLKGSESKVEVVKQEFGLDHLKECYLVDDYSFNLIEWENAQGIAIKYYNEYNSAKHPTSGFSISNFKAFDFFLNNYELKDLLVSSTNKFKLNMFTTALAQKMPITKIDILQQVYLDLKNTLHLDSLTSNTKYNMNNFLIEYYHFQDNINPNYWPDHFHNLIKEKEGFKVVQSCFDVDLKKLKIFDHEQNLTIKIVSDKTKESSVIFDLYLTLDESAFVEDIETNFHVLIDQLLSILFKKN